MTLINYFCIDVKKLMSRGATAIADAEIRPMEPETDNADAGTTTKIHEFISIIVPCRNEAITYRQNLGINK